MKKFKIYGFNNNKPIVITNTLEALSPASTFEETLTVQENKRASLSFNIYKKISVNLEENIENPFLPILYQHARIRYEDMETNSVIDFVITSMNYTVTKENVKYTIKAEDYASQIFAKRGQNMELDITGNIKEITDEILRLSALEQNTNDWKIELKLTDFMSPVDETRPKKATLILSNTNMYNALIEAALLFNANIDFDYKYKTIKFTSKVIEKFNGFRLRPDVNLSSITVGDSITNFTTAMHIVGGEIENDSGVKQTLYPLPDMPLAVKNYFAACVDNEFKDESYFKTYDKNNTYLSKYNIITSDNYMTKSDRENSTKLQEVKEYLQLCDLFPHLENTLYDIYYFYSIGAISEKKYNEFNNTLNNDIRKKNMAIKIHSERYYSSYVNFSVLKTEIQNQIEFLTAEETHKQKLLNENKDTTDSQKKIDDYKKKINDLITGTDFINAVLNIYGNKDTTNTGYTTGFDKLIADYTTEITNYKNQYSSNKTKISELTTQISGITDTSSAQYIILSSEKAGLEKINNNLIKLIGTQADSASGTVGTLGHWTEYLAVAKTKAPTNIITSAYDLVINQKNSRNLVNLKRQILNSLFAKYDTYVIETTYQNTEELSSYNLAEQAYLTFYGGVVPSGQAARAKHYQRYLGYNTPTRSFNLSFVDLSVLEDFAYLDIKIGDTIEINEPSLGINQERVRITSINYTLRDAAQTKLGVALITEEQDILQKLLLNLSK